MPIKVARKHIQQEKYDYIWKVDKGDGVYTGIRSKKKIDKYEGYEVLYFIQTFMNKHRLNTVSAIRRIEDDLHSLELQAIEARDDLIFEIEKKLGF